MRRDIQALKGATIELQKLEQLRPSLNEALEQTYQIAESAHREQEKAKSQVELNKALLDSHLAGRPGFSLACSGPQLGSLGSRPCKISRKPYSSLPHRC